LQSVYLEKWKVVGNDEESCLGLESVENIGQWSEFPATDPEVQVRFPALPDFLRSSWSGTGSSTQSREYK
jgi:hypothetical protein